MTRGKTATLLLVAVMTVVGVAKALLVLKADRTSTPDGSDERHALQEEIAFMPVVPPSRRYSTCYGMQRPWA
jgi:hypothetical protein